MDNLLSQKFELTGYYGQPSSSELLRYKFQWSDKEKEASGYASSSIISSVQARFISANMADNNNDDDLCHRMETQ